MSKPKPLGQIKKNSEQPKANNEPPNEKISALKKATEIVKFVGSLGGLITFGILLYNLFFPGEKLKFYSGGVISTETKNGSTYLYYIGTLYNNNGKEAVFPTKWKLRFKFKNSGWYEAFPMASGDTTLPNMENEDYILRPSKKYTTVDLLDQRSVGINERINGRFLFFTNEVSARDIQYNTIHYELSCEDLDGKKYSWTRESEETYKPGNDPMVFPDAGIEVTPKKKNTKSI